MVRCLKIAAFLALTVFGTTSTTTTGATTSGVVPTPTEAELERISHLLELAKAGKYPGTDRVRPGRRGAIPVWSQRTAMLYYNRNQAGEPLMWLTLAMGEFKNSKTVISDKKLWMKVWEEANPEQFARMKKYLPRTWADTDSFEAEMNGNDLYVYKPVLGFGGEGISFERGDELLWSLREQQEEEQEPAREFVVQEFIDPFLHNGRKTHMRPITLLIVQPDGTREFFVYNKMRVFLAAEDYDEARLLEGDRDTSFMLLSNMHQNKLLFESDPENDGKKFESTDCVLDAETALGSSPAAAAAAAVDGADGAGGLTFDKVFRDTKDMHSVIFSIIGDLLECGGTDVSLYDDACFHIMASDVAFDKHGTPYFLEMNYAMAYSNVWTEDEQAEFSDGVAALVKGTASPYEVTDSSMWERL